MRSWFFPLRSKCVINGLLLAGLTTGGFVVGCAVAAQPHMYNALNALQTARAELVAASPNKAGHREIAITRVNEAIYQVQLGIQAGGG